MTTDTEIQGAIEALRGQFPETKALYREVCALLFFRHGITPTASKLYQYVRKGSMSAPTEALARFWEELRSKARVEIDRPDLPDEVKAVAADAIQALWGHATERARQELAASRIEQQAEVQRAQEAERNALKQPPLAPWPRFKPSWKRQASNCASSRSNLKPSAAPTWPRPPRARSCSAKPSGYRSKSPRRGETSVPSWTRRGRQCKRLTSAPPALSERRC